MPIKPLSGVLDALFFVKRDDAWLERLTGYLRELSRGRPGRDQRENPDALRVVMHMDVLEQRLSGELKWDVALAKSTRPGDMSTAGRLYGDMVEMGGQLPRYEWSPIYLTADLFNPGNEAEQVGWDGDFEVVELLAHSNQLYPWQRGTLLDGTPIRPGDPTSYAKMTAYGTAFGEAMALGCEQMKPFFACADLKNAATFWTRAVAGMTPEEAQAVRFWDYLWPLSYWSPELLEQRPGLAGKLERLAFKGPEEGKIDPFERTGVKMTTRRLSTGGLFVQYRTILGTEGRTSRATVDAPLARQSGLKVLP